MMSEWTPFFLVVVNHPDLLMPISYLRNDVLQLPAFVDKENITGSMHQYDKYSKTLVCMPLFH